MSALDEKKFFHNQQVQPSQVADISQLRHYKINETPGTNFDTTTEVHTQGCKITTVVAPDEGKKVSGTG